MRRVLELRWFRRVDRVVVEIKLTMIFGSLIAGYFALVHT